MKELKYLNKYLAKYKWHLILGTIFIIISNFFQIIPAQLVRLSIDHVVENLRVYQSFEGFITPGRFFQSICFRDRNVCGPDTSDGLPERYIPLLRTADPDRNVKVDRV